MAKKIFMTAYDEKSAPSEEVVSINGVSFKYDKPFFLICNFPIADKAYFEFSVSDYYPIKAFRNVPLYIGISKEVSFGVLNSDFIIGSLYYNAETTEYDIMSKYSKQYLNYHTQPEHIYSRLPGAQDVIGLGVDYEENCLNIFINGKLFYKIQNNTYDEDGNILTSFDLTSGTFYFCIWSNIYYKKILSDFNLNSGDENIEKAKEISGVVNFNKSSYIPDGYISMKELYEDYNPPIDPEDEEDPTDAHIFDPTEYEGMNNTYFYIGQINDDISSTVDRTICEVEVLNDIDVDVNTLGLYCIPEHEGFVHINKYRYAMEATVLPNNIDSSNTAFGNNYYEYGYNLFVNKPIPTDKKVYFEFYVTEGVLKDRMIGIPVSIGIAGSLGGILAKSSRLDLFHEQWNHYYWKEMNNDVAVEEKTQQLHEIDNVYITTPPEQGQVIGVAFNLNKNKVSVYVNNYKMYTMRTYCAQDRESNEIFNYFTVENTNFLKLIGDSGTVYNQLSSTLPEDFDPGYLADDYESFGVFECMNDFKTYNVIYLPYHGRLEFYESDSILHFIPDDTVENMYHLNDQIYWLNVDDITGYISFTSDNGLLVYKQTKSDVMTNVLDNTMYEFREIELDDFPNTEYTLVKVQSIKKMTYSYLDYSKSWERTYAFIHDEGVFDGIIRGSFNFGQTPFAGTLPDGYMSLWDYYSITKATYDIQDLNCIINISNDRHIYNNILSHVKIVNSGTNVYNNNGINKMILNHTLITDQETHYHSIEGADLADFTATIARENNGYVPEEKLNSTSISFEGVVHYTIYIPTLEHQHIEVYLNSRNMYTTTFQAPRGAFIYAKLIADTGYTAGVLNYERFTINSDILLSATPATLTNYVVNILDTTHQTIEVVKVIGYDDDGNLILDEDTVYRSNDDNNNRFTCTIEDNIWYVRVISDMGYKEGIPNHNGVIVITKDTVISASDARIESYVVTVPITPHQVVEVRYNNTTHESSKEKEITFEVPFKSYIYISSKSVDVGYKIIGEYPDNQLIMTDATVEVPTVVDDMCTITVDDTNFSGEYTISNSTRIGNVYTIRRGSEVTITVTPSDGLCIKDFILE